MPDKIFVSYRRADSKNAASHVFDRVGKAFPDGLFFIDIDNIPPGHDFQIVLSRQLQASGLVLAIIGSDWLGPARDGMHHESRRIDDPRDFVRLEIEEAIRMRLPIIPILLNEARMPAVTALPDGMKDISKCKTIAIRQSSFDDDIAMILQEITSVMPLIRPVARPASWVGRKALSHFVIEWRKAGMPNQTITNSIRNEERMLLDITGQAVGNLLSQKARPGSKTSKEQLVAMFQSRVLLGFMLSRFMRNGRLDNDVLPKKFPTDFKNAGDLLSNWLEGQLATDEGLLRLANEDLWCDELTLELAASIWLMDFFGGQMERDIREIAADEAVGDALMQCVLMGAATHQFIHAGAPPPDHVDSSRVRMISISPPSAMTGSVLLAWACPGLADG